MTRSIFGDTMSTLINVGDTIFRVTMFLRTDGDWVYLNTKEQFAGKRVIVFALLGAFTLTCSSYQLFGFETMFSQFQEKGIDEIYCLSVNDFCYELMVRSTGC